MSPAEKPKVRVLHLEDNERDVDLVAGWLEDDGIACDITHVTTCPAFMDALQGKGLDVIISDCHLPSFDGLQALRIARERMPDVPFIIFSGTIGEEVAIQSLKEGATDYVLKQRPERLIAAVRQAVAGAGERARRKEAENRLREQAALLDKAQDAILVQDMEDKITFWNTGAQRIYGWTPDEVLGNESAKIFSMSDSPELREAQLQVKATGEWMGELKQTRKDGKTVVVESRWTLMRDDKGAAQGKLIINTDITTRKELEAQLRQAQKMEAVGQLAGGVAHDFNNLLTVIRGNAELLLLGGAQLSPEARECLNHVNGAVERAASLTRQLLLFSRKQVMETQPLELSSLVSNLTKMLKRVIREDIRLECQLSADLPCVQADPGMIEQVLMNLVVNARDAMPKGGQLEISTETVRLNAPPEHSGPGGPAQDYVCMSVTDTGVGIPQEHLRRIFEPFFTTKAPGQGTGLGLATVYGIVKQHQGWVEVTSRVGQGTRFRIFLPAAGGAAASRGQAAESGVPGGTETILLVEDDYQVRVMTRRVLESLGYNVLEAAGATEAISIWDENSSKIELLLSDIVLPDGMSGRELANHLRHRRSGLRVVLMSGYSQERVGHDTSLFRRPKAHFVQKPSSTSVLARTIRNCLEEQITPQTD